MLSAACIQLFLPELLGTELCLSEVLVVIYIVCCIAHAFDLAMLVVTALVAYSVGGLVMSWFPFW